ncbi:hypothetical protein N5P32_12615 [Marinomonas pontica]|uniref:hypothetical protein n=1 Tax=Marinomonas pontica TaxID=264739 RepID=UPI002244A022|nr:hypothetical protein [Marinomonas pontica]MCW8356697.1 hypothetical protein [Marinomonas pontica]
MKSFLLAALVLVSVNASADQIASLVNFESTAARPDTADGQDNITSILNTNMEFTLPENISFYGGFPLY